MQSVSEEACGKRVLAKSVWVWGKAANSVGDGAG